MSYKTDVRLPPIIARHPRSLYSLLTPQATPLGRAPWSNTWALQTQHLPPAPLAPQTPNCSATIFPFLSIRSLFLLMSLPFLSNLCTTLIPWPYCSFLFLFLIFYLHLHCSLSWVSSFASSLSWGYVSWQEQSWASNSWIASSWALEVERLPQGSSRDRRKSPLWHCHSSQTALYFFGKYVASDISHAHTLDVRLCTDLLPGQFSWSMRLWERQRRIASEQLKKYSYTGCSSLQI